MIRHRLAMICCGMYGTVSRVILSCLGFGCWFWAREEGFGADDMDSVIGINELRDVDVARGGDEGVGVVAGEVGVVGVLFGEEGDHVADGHLGGGLEVGGETHRDVGGGGFGAGPEEALASGFALMNDELEGASEEGFEGGDVDFAVALAGVAVAGFEECAAGVHGVKDDRADGEFLVVHVAAVHPGWCGVPLTGGLGRRDAHGAEEGVKRDRDAGSEVGGHGRAVEGDDLGAAVGEVVGEESAPGAEAVAGEVGRYIDVEDADFEDVAGFGFGDGDRPGEDVAAGPAIGLRNTGIKWAEPGGDFGGLDAFGLETLWRAAGGGCLHDDRVTGVHGEDGLGVGGVEAPGDRGGRGEEGLRGLGVEGCGETEGRCDEDESAEAHVFV
jgi:hypothetical protein